MAKTQVNPGFRYDIKKDEDGEYLEVHGQRVPFEEVRKTRKGLRIRLSCGRLVTIKRVGAAALVLGC